MIGTDALKKAEKFEKPENAIFWFSHIFHFLEKLINFGKFWFLRFLKKTKNKRFLDRKLRGKSMLWNSENYENENYEGENYEVTVYKVHAYVCI